MNTKNSDAETEELAEALSDQYLAVDILADGSIACLGALITTTAIHLGCDRYGWSRRFCFTHASDAIREFAKLKSEDDVPEGFIARRGR